MNFDETYKLLDLMESDDERETYRGREISGQNEVFLHLLTQNSQRVPSLLSLAERHVQSKQAASGRLLIGTLKNQRCLVTEATPEFRNIRSVLERAAEGDPFQKAKIWKVPVSADTPPATPAASQPAGDFTRIFSSPAPTPPPAAQGEFTRMFETPAARPSSFDTSIASPPATAAVPASQKQPSAPQPISGSSPEEGTFTQMFSVPAPQSQPGDFTRTFNSETPTPATPPAMVAKIDVFPPAAPKSEPGEFTRMFRSDASPAPASKENWLDLAEKPQQVSSLDNINWDSPPQPQGATASFAARQTAPPAPLLDQGPSEFTRLISVPSNLPAAEPQQPAPQAGPAAAPVKSYLPIIILGNVLLITVVALILYFLLKR